MKRTQKPALPSYAELVLEWAAAAHSVNADDRAAILASEIAALEAKGRARGSHIIQKLEAQRVLLESYSMSEDRCFEALATQIQAAAGVPTRERLTTEVELQ